MSSMHTYNVGEFAKFAPILDMKYAPDTIKLAQSGGSTSERRKKNRAHTKLLIKEWV